jgi:uncharacterized protein (TIGR02246 family)
MSTRTLLCLFGALTPAFALVNLDLTASNWSASDRNAVEFVSGLACHSRKTCAVLRSNASVDLSQTFDAAPYRGQDLTLRAQLRTGKTPPGSARLLIRVRHNDGTNSFEYDLGSLPVTLWHWASYELHAPVATDARDIQIGLQLDGAGEAWIDDVTVEPSSAYRADELVVRDVVAKFSAARNRHDGPAAAALYDKDAVWFPPDGSFSRRGRDRLSETWGRLTRPERMSRAVQSVEFPSANVAIVHVAAEFAALPPIPYLLHEVFVLIKIDGEWFIKVQQLAR